MTLTRKLSRLLLLGGILFLPTISPASETRVDSTGGLMTILDDETDNLSLFLDGNPAGLALLNTRDRLDLSAEWLYSNQAGPWGANEQQVLTTIPRYTDNPIKYEGWMVFPDPHWAFQVAGDAFNNRGVSVANYADDTQTLSNLRSLVRVAYALPIGALGLEIQNNESDKTDDPGLFNPNVGLASGSSAQNQFLVKAGIATTFPAVNSPEEPRWQAGGYFQTQIGSSLQNQNLNLFYLNGSPFPVNQVFTTFDSYLWGVDILYELPSVAKIRFSVTMNDYDEDFAQNLSNPEPPEFFTLTQYHLIQFQSMDVDGAFRLSLPFTDTENLKLGGSLDGYFYNTDISGTSGAVTDNKDKQQIATRFGIGLESPKEYTMGLQWRSLNTVSSNNNISNKGTVSIVSGTDYDLYQLAFGGEKWMGPTWAFRMGLVLEEDVYSALSTSTLTTTINVGAGLEQAFGRADVRFLIGQTTDNNNSSNTVGLLGAQISATFFL